VQRLRWRSCRAQAAQVSLLPTALGRAPGPSPAWRSCVAACSPATPAPITANLEPGGLTGEGPAEDMPALLSQNPNNTKARRTAACGSGQVVSTAIRPAARRSCHCASQSPLCLYSLLTARAEAGSASWHSTSQRFRQMLTRALLVNPSDPRSRPIAVRLLWRAAFCTEAMASES